MSEAIVKDSTQISKTGKNLFESFAQNTEVKEAGTTVNSDTITEVVDTSIKKEVAPENPINVENPSVSEPTKIVEEVIEQTEKKTLFNFKKEKLEEPIEEEPKNERKPLTVDEINKRTKTTADIYIGVLDSVQALSLKKVLTYKYKKKIGGEQRMTEALDMFDNFAENGEPSQSSLTVEQRTDLRLAKKMMKKIDDLPFTDEEIDKIRQPLITLIESNPSYDLPPSAVLMMALAQTLVPRTLDALFD